jgi:hypothetical protein
VFTSGQVSPVQIVFNGAAFNATSLAGVPRSDERAGYRGPAGLPTLASRARTRILRELFTVPHTSTMLFAGPHRVAGARHAWLERVRLDFPQAEANGWSVAADTMAILAVDHGGPVGVVFVSLPDTFTAQGDLDQVLSSVRVP